MQEEIRQGTPLLNRQKHRQSILGSIPVWNEAKFRTQPKSPNFEFTNLSLSLCALIFLFVSSVPIPQQFLQILHLLCHLSCCCFAFLSFSSVPSRIQFCCVVTLASHFHLTVITHTPSFSFALLWVQVQCYAAFGCFSDWFWFFSFAKIGFFGPPLKFGLLGVVGLSLIFVFVLSFYCF
ncbi:hypothetical protein VNO78_06488 [Psophocarpus tetragonolobus]|uniref:Transmembrane protein n=1 Tax=Psophocarpus tetragonolobus TaxID=3891 RepID=A0AAN9T1P1_PSOTE